MANGIHQDLYINEENKIIKFKREYSQYAENKPLIKFPEWGDVLLDEAIAQKMAQEMVKRKYGNGVYKKMGIQTKLSEPKVSFFTDFAAYPEYEKFAQTIVETQGLMGLYKMSVKPNFFDFIVSLKYTKKYILFVLKYVIIISRNCNKYGRGLVEIICFLLYNRNRR